MAINPKIKQKAEDIRNKIFGSEVRESLASGIEAISEDVEATIGRQDAVEQQFQNVIDETTDKDVISAPELIAARNGKSNLKTRLDDEHAEVTAQLQQIHGLGKFFDKLNKRLPATLICFGDSTTAGEGVTLNFVDRLSAYVKTTLGYGDLATIINAGIGGNTTIDGFNRLAAAVVNQKPDAVIINFGINDVGQGITTAESMKYYRYILEHIIAFCGSDTGIIIRTNNISRNIHDINVYDTYNNAIKKVATEYKAVFADYYSYMKSLNLKQEELLLYFLDGIHPNDLGYELMFNYMKQYIVPSTLEKAQQPYGDIELDNIKNVTTNLPLSQSTNFSGVNYFGHNGVKKITIKFYGKTLKWSFTKSNSAGKVKITADGAIIESELDLYNITTIWNSIYTLTFAENKVHTVVIDFLGSKNPLSTNSNVLMGGFYATFDNAMFFGYNAPEQMTSGTIDGKRIIEDSVSGVLVQGGYSSCDKGGAIILPKPFKSAYQVVCTQSGNAGGVGSTNEAIYFASSADYQLDRFYPRWDSIDTKKGINWIAIGV